jgi:hypothetical protein
VLAGGRKAVSTATASALYTVVTDVRPTYYYGNLITTALSKYYLII